MKAKFAIIAFFVFVYSFSFVKNTFSATLSISGLPAVIDQSQEFEANINLVCSGCSDSYLRGIFYPSGTSYFGFTQDNLGNWINAPGSSCTTFFKIAQNDLNSGSWSGTIKFKPDKNSSYFNGPGEYFFKVGRYTSSCASPSVWSDEKIIAITGPTPTFSPTNSPTLEPTNTKAPTSTPTTIKTPTPLISKKISITPELTPDVLSVSTKSFEIKPTSSKIINNLIESQSIDKTIFPKILILIGIVIILACAIVIFYPALKNFIKNKND